MNNQYIALLRGINVGGRKKILMADMRELLASIGFANITTYIQSGNVLFTSSHSNNLDFKISEAIKNNYGFEVSVLVLTKSKLQEIVTNNPFTEEKLLQSYYSLFHREPSLEHIEALDLSPYLDDECNVTPQCVYSFYNKGYGQAKCHNNFFESKLKVAATTRNHKTMTALTKLINSNT